MYDLYFIFDFSIFQGQYEMYRAARKRISTESQVNHLERLNKESRKTVSHLIGGRERHVHRVRSQGHERTVGSVPENVYITP